MSDEKKSQGFTNIQNEVIEMKIPPLEKTVLIVLLRYYNAQKGYSFPSYATLTKNCYVSKKTVIKALNSLEQKGIIKKECVKGKGNKYFITSGEITPGQKLHQGKNYTSLETTQERCKNYTSLVENLHPTNTNIITNTITNNNMSDFNKSDPVNIPFKNDTELENKKNTNSSKTKKTKTDFSDEIKEIVEYLNLKANKKYKPETKETERLISARLKEGYTVEDLKKVIDLKTSQWLHDEEMELYLRPSTLFNETKFESYINEVKSQENKQTNKRYLDYDDIDLSLEDLKKINLTESI